MATKRNPYQKQFDAVMERASSGGGITLADALIIKEYKAAQKKLEYVSPLSSLLGGMNEVLGAAKSVMCIFGGLE